MNRVAPPRLRARVSFPGALSKTVGAAAVVAVVWGATLSLSSGRLDASEWRSLVVSGVTQGSVYALLALGYTMVYGILGFINVAHGDLMMVGAISGWTVAGALWNAGDPGLSRWSATGGLWFEYPVPSLLLVLVFSAAAAALVSVLLYRVAFRPLRSAPRLVLLVTSVGASLFLQYSFANLFGPVAKVYPDPPPLLQGGVSLLGLPVERMDVVVAGATLLLLAGLHLLVWRTRAGRAMRAVGEDQGAAALMGVDVDRVLTMVFALTGALAGAAGFFWALLFPRVHFLSGFMPGFKAFAAAVVGGIGNIPGAVVGAYTLGVLEQLGPSMVLGGFGVASAWQLRDVLAFLLLIVVLTFRPQGMLGERLGRYVREGDA